MIIVVMGVAGSGKSTLGRALAKSLGWVFIEGDEHHPAENIAKMRAGHPLNDQDRRPWLDRLNALMTQHAEHGLDAVVACSALKAHYRQRLTRGLTGVRFAYLHGSPERLRARLRERQNHFMPERLLDSQIRALQPPKGALCVPIHLPTTEQVERVRQAMAL